MSVSRESLIVVALGGNAISRSDQEGNVDEQFENSRHTARALAELVQQGHQLVITHGNGPQIGNFLLRNEAGAGLIYPLPMEVAVAHVQGGMGFMIGQTLTNELHARGRTDSVTTIITTVLVDQNDPSFKNPTKPVGRTLAKAEADNYAKTEAWTMKEVSPGQFRRVVPSPMPRYIMEIETIRRAVANGETIIACGGGGIPVIRDPAKGLRGVRAVIDKDLASALLAAELDADMMLILTAVERVFINFGKPEQRAVDHMTAREAKQWLAEGQFPSGSMGPKVQGAIDFLTASKKGSVTVVIGPLDRTADAVAGRVGTRITR
jgi:carbamate kinase